MGQQGVSVIICTYNGAQRLPKTLRHLANQVTPPGLPWEVIVVDNNSNDNTFDAVNTEWASYNTAIAFTLAKQPKPGVSFAREMGIELSKYGYLIQCDDDNWLAENYVAKVFELLERNPQIGIVGGIAVGAFETTPPDWFDKFSTSYAVGQRKNESMPINWLASAGVGIRKEALTKLKSVNFHHILSGRKGKNLLAGDDLELCAAINAVGYMVYFSTELSFVHYMTANRLTWSYFKKMVKNVERPKTVFDMYTIVDRLLKQNKTANFGIVYKILWADIYSHIKIKCTTIRKALRFSKSLIMEIEGDPYGYFNRYCLHYLIYLAFNRKEIKQRYLTIEAFYKRVERQSNV